MLGLGERDDEVRRVLGDLRGAGVDIVTLGQYLAPEKNAFYLPVARFLHPDEFAAWKRYGEEDLGFRHVESGPLVRSSYHAENQAGGAQGQQEGSESVMNGHGAGLSHREGTPADRLCRRPRAPAKPATRWARLP